jgi:hypothetical protein
MLEELLRHDNLGDRREISFLLFQALTPDAKHRLSELRRFCISHIFSIGLSFDGIISLLRVLSVIRGDDRAIRLDTSVLDPSKVRSAEEYFQSTHFYELLFKALSESGNMGDFLNDTNVKFNSSRKQYYVQSHRVRFDLYPIRNLLLRVGFLNPDSTISDHLFISSPFTAFFEKTVADSIVIKAKKRRITLTELQRRLDQQAEVGRQGELVALSYEQRRMKKHFRLSEIGRVSEQFVNAGYDIISFDGEDSFVFDRFIEVKTFGEAMEFFWSENEVQVAQELGTRYWLYLVDRRSMETADFVPKMFQNPYQLVFQNPDWRRDVTSWKFFIV